MSVKTRASQRSTRSLATNRRHRASALRHRTPAPFLRIAGCVKQPENVNEFSRRLEQQDVRVSPNSGKSQIVDRNRERLSEFDDAVEAAVGLDAKAVSEFHRNLVVPPRRIPQIVGNQRMKSQRVGHRSDSHAARAHRVSERPLADSQVQHCGAELPRCATPAGRAAPQRRGCRPRVAQQATACRQPAIDAAFQVRYSYDQNIVESAVGRVRFDEDCPDSRPITVCAPVHIRGWTEDRAGLQSIENC